MAVVMVNHPGVMVAAEASVPAGQAYITLMATSEGKAGEALEKVLIGAAPMTGVSITDSVDMDTHKAFNGNYTVAVFGHSLVQINIRGLDIYRKINENNECAFNSLNDDIQGWWNEWNPADKPSSRIKLGIYSRQGMSVYMCMACALSRIVGTLSSLNNHMVGEYQLSIVGVRVMENSR